MLIQRGGVYRVDLGGPRRDGPSRRRPVLVVQGQPYNDSRLPTVLAVVITPDTRLATMPGNVFLPAVVTGLPVDAVANVTALVTLDRTALEGPVAVIPVDEMRAVERGLRGVLGM